MLRERPVPSSYFTTSEERLSRSRSWLMQGITIIMKLGSLYSINNAQLEYGSNGVFPYATDAT